MNGGNYYEYINSNWCRQPEAEGKISKTLILGCALAEATAIYGFVIALMIIIMLQ